LEESIKEEKQGEKVKAKMSERVEMGEEGSGVAGCLQPAECGSS
jgi:hypothetical protein